MYILKKKHYLIINFNICYYHNLLFNIILYNYKFRINEDIK